MNWNYDICHNMSTDSLRVLMNVKIDIALIGRHDALQNEANIANVSDSVLSLRNL